jgi:CheY-like chemotaxis protein
MNQELDLNLKEPAEYKFKPAGKVLIADDEPMCREVLIECLAEKGISASVFSDGEQLLDYVISSQEEISWVITDWTMPGLHGEALIRRLRQSRAGMKIFVTSGFVLNPEDMPRVEGLINKPFGPEELFQALAKALMQERS